MPQSVATVVYGLVILALFLLDRDRKSRVSPALWIPVAWVLLAGSRMFSDWLDPARGMQSPDQYLEGSPLDALIFTGLLTAGLMVLVARGRRTEVRRSLDARLQALLSTRRTSIGGRVGSREQLLDSHLPCKLSCLRITG